MSELNDKTIPTTQPATNAPGNEPIITNMEMYQNYKTQFERLKLAMENHFYLEAIFIEYAIMEDRTRAILGYEGNEIIKKSEREHIGIAKKVRKIINISQPGSVIGTYFSDDLMNQLLVWINQRNGYIHALMRKITTTEGLRDFAERGGKLCRELSNRATAYRRMVEKHRSESSENTN